MTYKIGLLADIAEGKLMPEKNKHTDVLAHIVKSPDYSGLFAENELHNAQGKYNLYCLIIDRAKENHKEEILEKFYGLQTNKAKMFIQVTYNNLNYLIMILNNQKKTFKYIENKKIKIYLQKALDDIQYWMKLMYENILEKNDLPTRKQRLNILFSIRCKLRKIETMVPDADPVLIQLLNEPLNNALEESEFHEDLFSDLKIYGKIANNLYTELKKKGSSGQ